MWIIPQNLHTLAYVPDTGALISDLNELSEALEPSLLVRSKPTRSQTWLRKLKTDTWTRRLYGRTLKPSHGEHFAGAWTFSAVASLVSHSAPQDGEQGTMTPATYGPTLSEGLESWADLPLFSSKMSREYLAQTSAVQGGATPPGRRFCNISSASWSAWITERRREYLARLKLAPRISASVYLSSPSDQTSAQTDTQGLESCWRTPTAQESGKGSKGDLTDKSGEPWTGEGRPYFNGQLAQITLDQQVYADARQWNTPRVGASKAPGGGGDPNKAAYASRLENQVQEQTWPTPTTAEQPMRNQIVTATGRRLAKGQTTRSYGLKLGEAVTFCPTTQVQEQTWPTPTTQETPHYEITLTPTGRREGVGEGATSHSLNLCDAARLAEYAEMIADPSTPERLRRKLSNRSTRWQTPCTEETSKISNNPLDIGQLQISNDPLLRIGAIYGPQDEAPDSTHGSPRASHLESRNILNPRWVEVLMGVPVGWVMATCDAPLTAAQMSLDFWGMELYPPQQSEPLGCCGES